MEEPTRETCDLAFELFDKYGRVQRDYINHAVRKETGVWGAELDRGDLLFIEKFSVQKNWQRKGLGTRLFDAVLEKAQQKIHSSEPPIFVVVRPGFLHAQVCAEVTAGKIDDENNVAHLHHLRSEAFWRSLGFRRIGTSAWFALANTHEHPSRQLAANHDWYPPATGQLDVKTSLA